jgi:carotenoid cleavage dioxygenase-like enzyme
MNRIKKASLFTIIVLGIIWGFTSSFQKPNELTKQQAIKLAEQFIIDNGYTNFTTNKTKLNSELLDEKKINNVLARRKNTLHKKAFCFLENKDRWDIGFLSTSININKLDSIKTQSNLSGRVIIVPKNGKEIRIAHKEALFSYFEKL